jgi:putative phage-type endonuclease
MNARREWLGRRRETVGASEVSAILGLNPWESPYSLWAKKTGAEVDSEEETPWQYWGNKLEPLICDEYARETGRTVVDHGRYAIRYSETCPNLSATLDREVVAFDARGPGCMDAKSTSAFKLGDWDDTPPLVYQVQLQAQMEVTGYRWGSLAALIGGNTFRWCDVERDDRFIDMMRRKVGEFWRLVETRTPPPIDNSNSTADVLRRLYPQDNGETIALPGEASNWTDTIAECDAVIKGAEERKRECKSKLIAALGSATFGVLPAGGRWSFKAQTRKAHHVEESTSRVLRRLAK